MIGSKIAKAAEKVITDNSPLILTVVGAVGTVTTAYLTGKASYEAGNMMAHKHQTDKPPTVWRKDELKHIWKLYIPAAGAGVTTLAAIICAHKISASRAAALAAAYSLSQDRFSEYRDKVQEKLGVKKEKDIRDEISQQRVDKQPYNLHEVYVIDGDVPCFDEPSERYFSSSMEGIRQAVNDLNQQVLINGYATLADFYEQLNLKPTPASNEIGWTRDALLDVHISPVLPQGEKRPALGIDYTAVPIRGFK